MNHYLDYHLNIGYSITQFINLSILTTLWYENVFFNYVFNSIAHLLSSSFDILYLGLKTKTFYVTLNLVS